MQSIFSFFVGTAWRVKDFFQLDRPNQEPVHRSAFCHLQILGAFVGFLIFSSAEGAIRIGVSVPLSGKAAAVGLQMKIGVEEAVRDINESGGMLGQPIELHISDDAGEPREGVNVVNKFVADNVQFVIGSLTSAVTLVQAIILSEHGTLQITPSATSSNLTESGLWNIFRVCGRDDQQGKVAGAYLAKAFREKKIMIVHDKTSYGKGLAEETKAALNAAGIQEIAYESVNTGEKDYSSLVLRVKALGADILYWGGSFQEAGLVIRQMREYALPTRLMSGDATLSGEFAELAGKGAVGTLMTLMQEPENNAGIQSVRKKLEKRNIHPELYAFRSYAALELLKQAVEQAASLDSKTVAAFLRSGAVFHTLVGDITFNNKGDINSAPYAIYEWRPERDGKISYFPVKDF